MRLYILSLILIFSGYFYQSTSQEVYVILISLDGTRPNTIDIAETPNLDFLREGGVEAEYMLSVFPASTFPSHASIASGAYPQTHGIINNTFFDQKKGSFYYENDVSWYQAEPLWITAEKQGIRTAVLFWVCSRGEYDGFSPTYNYPYRDNVSDDNIMNKAIEYLNFPEGRRPTLMMIWLSGTDHEGHVYGPESRDVLRALEREDRVIGKLISHLQKLEIFDKTTIILLSDHGMAQVSKCVNLELYLKRNGIGAYVYSSGATSNIYLKVKDEVDEAKSLLTSLEGISDVYEKGELEEELFYQNTRTGDLVVIAKRDYRFCSNTSSIISGSGIEGMHGYRPEMHEMHSFFIIFGPKIKKNQKIDPFRNIDINPTIAYILGIQPSPKVEGVVLWEIFLDFYEESEEEEVVSKIEEIKDSEEPFKLEDENPLSGDAIEDEEKDFDEIESKKSAEDDYQRSRVLMALVLIIVMGGLLVLRKRF
ncbi:MAG: ectonucleotide pyrophosphatase/phosphodiesterase [Candidatus Methanofastidiosia archaeon]